MKNVLFPLLFVLFSNALFAQISINPCAQLSDLHVVVIGSSTAAGAGPTVSDSAWVNRYRAYLQAINPNNQVTNLAIGGTTTYHIMPDWFVAPAGRPTRNPNNNVTQAISLGADAIIVNMPSNDAANNFGINEQMSNFITMFNSADSAGIPVWICTTQPRNFSAAQKAIQLSVRDSIFSYFGMYAIDFWNGSADVNHDILPQYDSGDGVHMNNAGHGILVSRVIDKGIPNVIADTASSPDHLIHNLYLDNHSICGDSNSLLQVVIGNTGIASSSSIDLDFFINDHSTGSNSTITLTMANPMPACALDTLSLNINTYMGVDWSILATLNSGDLNTTNDSAAWFLVQTLGHPSIAVWNDTICLGDSSTLVAQSGSSQDSILWYDAPTGGNIIGSGPNLVLQNVLNTQSYYPTAIRGDLYYNNSLATSTNTTTNWNGMMFDIVASDTLTIDSFSCKFFDPGAQQVLAYYRIGSHIGHENTSPSWTFWGSENIQVATNGSFEFLDYSDLNLMPGDTLAVYLHLQNSAARLSYLNTGAAVQYSNNELQIINGTGISYTFGTTYTPRNWCGEIFYHHGFNPNGACATPRTATTVVVSEPQINLGNDTTLLWDQALLLNTNGIFDSYLWSNNTISPQLLVDSSNANLGLNSFWLSATDAYGCTANDTILVTFSLNTALAVIETLSVRLVPNPSRGWLEILDAPNAHFTILDIHGKILLQTQESTLDLSHLPKGLYFIKIEKDKHSVIKKIILQ